MTTVAVIIARHDDTHMNFATVSVQDPEEGQTGNEVRLEGHCLDLETGDITDDGTQWTQQEWEFQGPAWVSLYAALANHPAVASAGT